MSDKKKKFIHLTSHVHELSWKTETIGEGEAWICLNKQTHLGTEYDHHHQDRPHMEAIVEQDLTRQAGWIRERGIEYLKPVNILDFETTGASLCTKQIYQEAADQIMAAIAELTPNSDCQKFGN